MKATGFGSENSITFFSLIFGKSGQGSQVWCKAPWALENKCPSENSVKDRQTTLRKTVQNITVLHRFSGFESDIKGGG